MKEYKKINYLPEELAKHKTGLKKSDGPSQDESTLTYGVDVWILDDGMEVEVCNWYESDMHLELWDFKIDREMFDNSGNGSFVEYIAKMGLPTENVMDEYGMWRYAYTKPEEGDKEYWVQYIQNEW